jgi:hypothetical protein
MRKSLRSHHRVDGMGTRALRLVSASSLTGTRGIVRETGVALTFKVVSINLIFASTGAFTTRSWIGLRQTIGSSTKT